MLQELALAKTILFGSKRERRVLREGTEEIPVELTIPPSSFQIVDFEEHEVAKKYVPLDEITIINTGATKVKVYYNQSKDDTDIVPSGAVISHDKKSIRTLKVENLDSSNSATVVIRAKKKPITQDELLRRLI